MRRLQMPRQITPDPKILPTKRARKRPLARMRAQMHGEARRPVEGALARRACEQFPLARHMQAEDVDVVGVSVLDCWGWRLRVGCGFGRGTGLVEVGGPSVGEGMELVGSAWCASE